MNTLKREGSVFLIGSIDVHNEVIDADRFFFLLYLRGVGDLLSSMLFKCNGITLLTKSDLDKY